MCIRDRHKSGDLFHARICVLEEVAVAGTVAVFTRRFLIGKKEPVPAAAVPAQRIPAAGGTFVGNMVRELYELQRLAPLIHFFKGIVADISQLPFVQDIEITGVDAPVRLHNPLFGTCLLYTSCVFS